MPKTLPWKKIEDGEHPFAVFVGGEHIADQRMKIVERAVDILRSRYPDDFDWEKHSLALAIVPKDSANFSVHQQPTEGG